ncbi:hypothetical protein L873DRAFT_1821640 [Choiromyces venosus 120613-1]|uniref:Uncharacterized protein n=1 Tax=Choiromyces venosus 120613-1 TaxID=1336337 RepID=A0A3N4IZF8_9PEZI|nr:hypothetical protein L873DRAFT_1821640 [Choiromyces venosus 120613-1]
MPTLDPPNRLTVPRLWLRHNPRLFSQPWELSSRECPTAQHQIRLNDTFNLYVNLRITNHYQTFSDASNVLLALSRIVLNL